MFPVQFISTSVAILTAIIGFYVTSVVEEIRSGTAVIYSVEKRQGEAVLFLKNASREATINSLHVGISCTDFSQRTCFPLTPNERKAVVTKFAPIAGNATKPVTTPITVDFEATLVAGAKLKVTMPVNKENKSDLLFVYFPNSSKPESAGTGPTIFNAIIEALKKPSLSQETPVFLKRGGITALFVEYYFSFMALAMLVTTILLMISIGWWVYHSISNAKKPLGEHKNDSQKFIVDFIMSSRKPGD